MSNRIANWSELLMKNANANYVKMYLKSLWLAVLLHKQTHNLTYVQLLQLIANVLVKSVHAYFLNANAAWQSVLLKPRVFCITSLISHHVLIHGHYIQYAIIMKQIKQSTKTAVFWQ